MRTVYRNNNFNEINSKNPSPKMTDFFYNLTFSRTKNWLSQLPVAADCYVFLARQPEKTLIVKWGLFIDHWDAFYCDRYCTLNVIGTDPRWFLFMHQDQIAIWGATSDYIAEKGFSRLSLLNHPLDYRTQLLRMMNEDREKFAEQALKKYLLAKQGGG